MSAHDDSGELIVEDHRETLEKVLRGTPVTRIENNPPAKVMQERDSVRADGAQGFNGNRNKANRRGKRRVL